jgi:hypothetical protein
MTGTLVTIAALVLSAGLAWAQCPSGLGGGTTYVVDAQGVVTLTACDQTWVTGVNQGRRVRILLHHMTVVVEPAALPTLDRGGISLTPQGMPIGR